MSIGGVLRRTAAGLAVVTLGAMLTSCGGSAAQETEKAGAAVTVTHEFGTTTVKGAPKRVVALDQQWTDVLLTMGVKPVGAGSDPRVGKDGRAPWQTALPASAKTFPIDLKGPPLETIAALHPDLILGSFTIPDRAAYEKLAGIAPTVPAIDARQVERWPDLVRTAGRIFGDAARADRVIAGVNGKVATIRKQMPWLRGKTFALAQYMVGDSVIAVADPTDGSTVLFNSLGMKQYPALVAEGKKQKEARISVSRERLDVLRSDLLMFMVNGGSKEDLKDLPGWGDLPAVRGGSAAVLAYPTIAGLNVPTPLSVPAALDKVTPALRALR